mgnify:CR=1 FL=1
MLDGYDDVEASLVMLLEGDLRAAPPAHTIVPVTTDADWDGLRALEAPRLGGARRSPRPRPLPAGRRGA